MIETNTLLDASPYHGYSYSYPHKTAYRPLDPPVELGPLWQSERRDSLFLYVHVPFCEMRCGFCNLFARSQPQEDTVAQYLDALERQANVVGPLLDPATFARFAIGGGTPTYLEAAQLQRVLRLAERFGVDPKETPVSIETSPGTATADRLTILRDWGVDRISIGVQSFREREVHSIGRPQQSVEVHRTLERLRSFEFPTLNIDLMYGLQDQSVDDWLDSLASALRYQPEELYLYPLYVREQTGLGRRCDLPSDLRLQLYREARDYLLDNGYVQLSMRMFRSENSPGGTGPIYCCQRDGMVGLGCGARSYTSKLHYANSYAVATSKVESILNRWIARPHESFAYADHGYALTEEDQRRRYVIQSLLQAEGLDLGDYCRLFATDPLEDLPELEELESLGLAEFVFEEIDSDPRCGVRRFMLRLTDEGMERSDAIGPWLYSERVRSLMESHEAI